MDIDLGDAEDDDDDNGGGGGGGGGGGCDEGRRGSGERMRGLQEADVCAVSVCTGKRRTRRAEGAL